MNSLTNIAGYRPESDNSPVSRAGLPPGPALPVGPLDPHELKQILESQRYEELLVEYENRSDSSSDGPVTNLVTEGPRSVR